MRPARSATPGAGRVAASDDGSRRASRTRRTSARARCDSARTVVSACRAFSGSRSRVCRAAPACTEMRVREWPTESWRSRATAIRSSTRRRSSRDRRASRTAAHRSRRRRTSSTTRAANGAATTGPRGRSSRAYAVEATADTASGTSGNRCSVMIASGPASRSRRPRRPTASPWICPRPSDPPTWTKAATIPSGTAGNHAGPPPRGPHPGPGGPHCAAGGPQPPARHRSMPSTVTLGSPDHDPPGAYPPLRPRT